ncbi:hypothetical protein PT974_03411 [Cladobotryum mycophilum]|uniref:Trafficking protein particle complex subunit 11 n=1 Tax=Cladobotryum mycophilum TaxID=491253 RepID=A0ABR0SS80_9HYPO
MDGYPLGSLDHNVPLIFVSGISAQSEPTLPVELREQGILIRSDLPCLESREANFLGTYFEEADAKGLSWTAISREEQYRLRIKTIGRSILLPSRRAPLPESFEPLTSAPILHSPFSPLSPASGLYPDGLIDARWVKKHQELIPSVIACFYPLTSDPTTTTLHDNRLKTDINNIKSGLARSGYKTRLAIVILGDEDSSSANVADTIAERLENIRKGTGLDPKSIFYIPPQETPTDFQRVVDNILSALYTIALEYYRDLGRHARKKRSRGIAPPPTIPPTSGTSQTLSVPDWNFRYDFKSAVFAEFRHEIDVAIRSFEQAYDILLSQDVFELLPSWSPRWNEARLLADIISIRCLRLHLWMGQSSMAVRRWQAHRERVTYIVENQGRGTQNYGWQAWEARWAMVMANLIEMVEIPGLAPSTSAIYLPPEKPVLGERLKPWELLHHTGYWYRIAAGHLARRREFARRMPEEDRGAPDASPASQVASKAYMTQFQARKQHRIAAEIAVDCAKEMASQESWNEVVAMLRPIWEDSSFRSEWWIDISEDVLWLMRRAAASSGRGDLVVAIDWELMDRRYTLRPKWHYDLEKSLEGVKLEAKPSVSISDDNVPSFVSATFVFRSKEGRAGETCLAQLSLKSDALKGAAPVVLSSIEVRFTGSLKPILIEHDSENTAASSSNDITTVSTVSMTEDFEESEDNEEEKTTQVRGKGDLTLKPGQRRVFELDIPLRESGDAQASSVLLSYKSETFDLNYSLKFRVTDKTTGWFIQGLAKPRLPRPDGHALHILPRPPKVKLRLDQPLSQYYANEPIELRIKLVNEEDGSANVKLDVNIIAKSIPPYQVEIGDQKKTAEAGEEESRISGLALGVIERSASQDLVVRIDPAPAPTAYEVQVRALYHLESDAATPIVQLLPIDLNIVNAFEANYDLLPRLHPDPWPSLFDSEGLDAADETNKSVRGLAQQWCLACHYASFAGEDLDVLGMDMTVTPTGSNVRCSVVSRPEISETGIVVSPKTMQEAQFDLVVQKFSLDDRHPVSIDLAFIIRWRRRGKAEEGGLNTTTMSVGQYGVLGSEPRVMASVLHSPPEGAGLVQLDLTIENPSSHFLTFGLTMEPSDAFAFSGAKQTTMNLLPMSRRTRTYRLLPLVRGVYVRPGLVVRDKYFQKVLRIIPTEGMKIDKDGLLLWVPSNEAASEKGEGSGSGSGGSGSGSSEEESE